MDRATTECFLEAMVEIFSTFGGEKRLMWIDGRATSYSFFPGFDGQIGKGCQQKH